MQSTQFLCIGVSIYIQFPNLRQQGLSTSRNTTRNHLTCSGVGRRFFISPKNVSVHSSLSNCSILDAISSGCRFLTLCMSISKGKGSILALAAKVVPAHTDMFLYLRVKNTPKFGFLLLRCQYFVESAFIVSRTKPHTHKIDNELLRPEILFHLFPNVLLTKFLDPFFLFIWPLVAPQCLSYLCLW